MSGVSSLVAHGLAVYWTDLRKAAHSKGIRPGAFDAKDCCWPVLGQSLSSVSSRTVFHHAGACATAGPGTRLRTFRAQCCSRHSNAAISQQRGAMPAARKPRYAGRWLQCAPVP